MSSRRKFLMAFLLALLCVYICVLMRELLLGRQKIFIV